MKCIEISKPGGPEVLVPAERPNPAPKANEILIKVCQNEQTENWAQSWMFQLRLCDATGVAVPFTVVAPAVKPIGKDK